MTVRGLLPFVLCVLAAGCAAGRGAGHPAVGPDPAPPAAAREPSPPVPGPPQAAARIDFASVVRPILEARCAPCHFEGGTMHDRLPFDRPETIRMLGTRLFTRIKDEADQAAINAFLAQPTDEAEPSGSP